VVCRTLYHFVWDELADWYVEAVKVRLYGDDEAAAATARQVLANVADRVLRLLHPVMPFVTETLWRSLTGAEGGRDSLMVAAWPLPTPEAADPAAERDFALLQDLVTEVRKFRSQNNIAPSARFELTVASGERDLFETQADLVASLAGLSGLVVVDDLAERSGTSTIVFEAGQAQVELAGLIDVEGELDRLRKELGKAEGDLQRVEGKLANASFVERAPAEVVDRERARGDELRRAIEQLGERIDALATLAG
jgi:valyl-tRNA synthetase